MKIIGVGETGLDFYYENSAKTMQKRIKEELNLISIGDIEVKYEMSFFNKPD